MEKVGWIPTAAWNFKREGKLQIIDDLEKLANSAHKGTLSVSITLKPDTMLRLIRSLKYLRAHTKEAILCAPSDVDANWHIARLKNADKILQSDREFNPELPGDKPKRSV